ncbi:roundabout homolog 2-like isoform X2 [Argopecten irradians]|uniref:roundabout homolog 2-like isoform X2 n=1 Tax=Argopecten irradians TaxID=31199 RepID=UPI00370FDCA8
MVGARWRNAHLLYIGSLLYLCGAAAPNKNLPNPRITEHPQDDYLSPNNPETLDCRAEGEPKPTITWYHNGQRVITYPENPSTPKMLIEDRKLFFLSVTHNRKESDVGVYYCNATNIHGSAISRNATLKIAVLKDNFRESPSGQSAAVGETVTFHCQPPKGEPEPTILWLKSSEQIQTGSSNNRFQVKPNGDLVITSTRKRDAGIYKCIASNKAGERESSPATLKVLEKPSFRRYPVDVTTTEGKTIEFPCDVIGDQPLNVEWKKEGGVIKYGRMRKLPDNMLRIEDVESSDAGTYICVATNAVGTTEAVATLIVQFKPVFIVKPQDKHVAVGRTVTLPCAVMANPIPNIYWNKKRSLSTSSKESLMFPNFEEGRYAVATDGTLRISRVQMEDAGDYECEALNTLGIITARVTLTVRERDPRPPPIIQIGPQNQTLPTDEVGFLRCEASGLPEPRVQWFKDSNPIKSDPRIMKLNSGTLQISDLRESDSGTYTCKATSETGETTWSAVLQVEAPSSHQTVPYHRSPDTSSYPGIPSRPIVTEVTSDTAQLSWTANANHGDSQVFAFIVEYFSYETMDGWMVASDMVQQESYTISGLQPDTSYLFLVRGKNSHGIGQPSPLSDPIRTRRLPRGETQDENFSGIIVQMMEGVTINSSAIRVTWRVLKEVNLIDRFVVQYTEILELQRLFRGKSYQQTVGTMYRAFTLSHLKSSTWYEVCVMAYYNGNSHTPCSTPLKVQTSESRPTAPPEDIIIHKESDSSIHIQWLPPPKSHRNGEIRGYEVECLSSDNKHNCSIRVNGTTNQATIKRLDADMTYTIKVAARTIKGAGVWSKAFIVGPEQPSIMDETWFIGMLIGTIGGTVWIALCIFSVWLCRKRSNKKKMMKNGMYSVPMHKTEDTKTCNSFYRNGYGQKDIHSCVGGMGSPSPEASNLLDQKDMELQDQNIYNIPQMKTFYHKKDPVAPYATTTLINAGLVNAGSMGRPAPGMDHMFRPITGTSGGSGDSCCKHEHGSSDSNTDNSRPNTGIPHDHSDAMQSPTSDSGSHTTDENGLLIKRGKKSQKQMAQPKQAMVNWAEFLPPPPEHPPPNEMGHPGNLVMNENPSNNLEYAEVSSERAGGTRSPISPMSKISSCSCPVPHNGTQNWNVPAYSDNGCVRCSSPKYCESWHYNPAHYSVIQQRTQSPRNADTWGQRTIACMHPSSRGTPVDVRCARTCHSDHEQAAMPALHNYKIAPGPRDAECYQCLSDSDRGSGGYHTLRGCRMNSIHGGSGSDGGGGGTAMDRACQSSLPSVTNECIHPAMYPPRYEVNDNGQHMSLAMEGYNRNGDSPTSEGGLDYVGESDVDISGRVPPGHECPSPPPGHEGVNNEDGCTDSGSMLASWASVTDQSNTDCSSVRSSAASSSDGSFLTEADFASAVAKAAEMSGLTVVGTTVCDPKTGKPVKRQRRHHRTARPSSPYSTDSNFSAVVHKPYPKSQRKKQLVERGKRGSDSKKHDPSPIPEGQATRHGIQEVPEPPSYNKPSFPSPLPYKSPRTGHKSLSPTSSVRSPRSPGNHSALNFGALVIESNVPVV